MRFQGINVLPPSVPAAPPGGFPQTPPETSDIYETIDDTLVTPYAHTFNAVASFELTKNFNIEAAYVGRQGRNLLVQRDLFMPLNLADPESGTDYFTASTELIKQLEANGFDHTAVTPIAYYENMFPDAANAAEACRTTRGVGRVDGHTGDGLRVRLLVPRSPVGDVRFRPGLLSRVHQVRCQLVS